MPVTALREWRKERANSYYFSIDWLTRILYTVTSSYGDYFSYRPTYVKSMQVHCFRYFI